MSVEAAGPGVIIVGAVKQELTLDALVSRITPDIDTQKRHGVRLAEMRCGEQIVDPGFRRLIILDFDPQAGHEQAGWRPAIVLSPATYNSRSDLAFVCPITSQAKGYPFEVPMPKDLNLTGVVLSDHLKSSDWRVRRAKLIEKAPRELVETVKGLIALILDA